MNSENPSENEILAAIKKSGYLYEQKVADIIEENTSFRVFPNWAFKDTDENKSREIDIRAFNEYLTSQEVKTPVFVEFLIECKNTSNPLVFLVRNKNKADLEGHVPEEYVFPFENYHKIIERNGTDKKIQPIPAFHHLELSQEHYFYSSDKKAVQFYKIARNNGEWEAFHGGIYNSIFFPLVKALELRKNEFGNMKEIELWFPIVVVSGSLYELDTTRNNLTPERTKHVSLVREVHTESLSGRYVIDFVNDDYLIEFIEEKVTLFINAVCDIVKDEAISLLEKEIN